MILLILLGFLVVLTVPFASATVSAGNPDGRCLNPHPDIVRQNGVSLPPEEATVKGQMEYNKATQKLTITYQNLSAADEFWIDLTTKHYDRGVRVVGASGFTNLSSDIGYNFIWDGHTRNPKLTLTATSQSSVVGEDLGYAAAKNWGFLPVPSHSASTHLTLDEAGFVGDQFILVGSNTVYTESVGCQNIRLIVPKAANLSESPEQIINSLASASRQFDVGPRYSYINAYAVTNPIRRGGAAETHEFWVHDSATFDFDSRYQGGVIPANTWLHEYTHTSQLFTLNSSIGLDRKMAWFTEASATYYAVELTSRQQYAGPCAYSRYFVETSRTRIGTVVLSDPSQWGPNDQGQYRKGAVVLSALDQRIRNETGGRRTLGAVVRRMNTHDGTVTYADFKEMVESTAGTSLDSWLDKRITTSHDPQPGIRKTACQRQLIIEQLLTTTEGQLILLMSLLIIISTGYRIKRWVQN